ncbi:dynein axonemal intermediate chain 3 [Microcaecilia unicolor]|uniref:WD repeat-containing protein 63 n=1 Tax=Microcaecilia unicolor TaxID=1415580 RepID=A0A6P7YH06_9AMPH|nr:WD repeat-containing protein 63 [Microcaecilia unicolor]
MSSGRGSSRSRSPGSKGSAKKPKGKRSKSPGSGKKKGKRGDDSLDAPISSGHPEYIVPLVLTTHTQQIFQCQPDEEFTMENPFKLIKKADILNDLKTRAAISDFSPVKKLVADYPGEELLLVFDKDFKYGQNFYLVTTEEAKENILHPPETLEKEGDLRTGISDEYIYKPPVQKEWVSLGSEKEVEEEAVKESVDKIKYMVSRIRRHFGAPVFFDDHNASDVKDGYIECTSYEDKRFVIKRIEKNIGIQVVPNLRDCSTQTKWTYPKNACTQYLPREFSDEEKKQLLSSKKLNKFINSACLRLELALQQNEIINAFFDDWKALAEDESLYGSKSDTQFKEYQSFTDLHYSKEKTISCIKWHPTIYGLVAVAVTECLTFEDRINMSAKLRLTPSLILIWSFTDPIHPQLILECPDDIFCFQFCPSDPNIIAGGCINGQVVLWDISEYEERLHSTKPSRSKNVTTVRGLEAKTTAAAQFVRYCALSSIEFGHKALITDLHWLPDLFEVDQMGYPHENENGVCVQLVTCSPDCSVMFWDIRPPKTATNLPVPAKKMNEEKFPDGPQEIPTTFINLDLAWKPLIKVTISRIDTGGEYSPIKISLGEEHYSTKIQDKFQVEVKKEKNEGNVDYSNLTSASTKNLKPLDNINTNFFIGSEDGELIYSDWKMEKETESERLVCSKALYTYTVHDGIVHTVQRSPFFKDIVLTVGGWNFAIWKEGGIGGPILKSCCSTKRLTAGHWSLSRAGVFFIGKEDGNVDIWDLLEKTHEPSQTQNISSVLITCIKPWIVSSKQHFLAVSDEYGTLYILEIPWTLRSLSSNETSLVQNYFEREVKHLDYLQQRKIFRAKEKKEAELQEEMKKLEGSPPHKSKDEIEEELSKEYENFLATEKRILVELGLRLPEQEKNISFM